MACRRRWPRGPSAWPSWALACVCTCVWVCACSDASGPEPQGAATPAGASAPAAGPTTAAAVAAGQDGNGAGEVKAFSYSPVGRRDPFRSYLTQVQERLRAQVRDHHHEATEDFEIGQYHLVGLVTGTSRPKAMVDDPNGEAHVLHVGSRIGKNGGRVASIGPEGLTVEEQTVDAGGRAVSVPIHLRLPEDVLDLVPTED